MVSRNKLNIFQGKRRKGGVPATYTGDQKKPPGHRYCPITPFGKIKYKKTDHKTTGYINQECPVRER